MNTQEYCGVHIKYLELDPELRVNRRSLLINAIMTMAAKIMPLAKDPYYTVCMSKMVIFVIRIIESIDWLNLVKLCSWHLNQCSH